MSKSLAILTEIACRVKFPGGKDRPPVSLVEMEIGRRYRELEEAIKEDLAAKSRELRGQGGKAFWPANGVDGVKDLLDQIIDPIDKFGNMLACITDDEGFRAESIGLTIMAMADGMRHRCTEFEKKMEGLDVIRPKQDHPDVTIVGAEIVSESKHGSGIASVCNQCLTVEENASMSQDEADVVPISSDEADERNFTCKRCNKPL